MHFKATSSMKLSLLMVAPPPLQKSMYGRTFVPTLHRCAIG